MRESAKVRTAMQGAITDQAAGERAELDDYSCFGRCKRGVNVLVRPIPAGETKDQRRRLMLMPTSAPGALLYNRVQVEEVGRIVAEHVLSGQPIYEWTQRVPPDEPLAAVGADGACALPKLER